MQILLTAVTAGLGGALAVIAWRLAAAAYAGRDRSFLDPAARGPVRFALGRYLGLLPMRLIAGAIAWIAAVIVVNLWWPEVATGMWFQITMLYTVPPFLLLAAVGFSWWMPFAWRPAWLQELDRESGHAPAHTYRAIIGDEGRG